MSNIDMEENRSLLYRYLVKYAKDNNKSNPKELAKKMMRNYINNLFGINGLSSWLGEKSIEYFCMHYLGDVFSPKDNNDARKLAPVHKEIWRELECMFITDQFDKLELVMPRGCAKTTVCDFAISVWLHCYQKSKYTLVCGRTEGDAIEFIDQIRKHLEENSYILESFGQLIDSKKYTVNKLELELSNKTKVQAISSTSSMRGKKYDGVRPSCIIADDYQGKNDVVTEEARNKKYNTFIEDASYAGDKAVYRNGKKIKPATKYIVLGTILHRDCFMSRLLGNKDYKHILKRVVEFDIDEYFNSELWNTFKSFYFNDKSQDGVSVAKEFYYQNEKDMQYDTIWPDKFNCLDLAIDYYNNTTAFKQEMMNDASKIGEKWFKSNRIQTSEEIEENTFTKTMLCIDPANSVTAKSDYTAICIGSLSTNGFKYIRKGLLLKLDFNQYCQKVVDILKGCNDISHIYIEKNLYMGADVLKIKELINETPELRCRKITFINEMQKKNKDEKISTIINDVNNGRIIFNIEDKEFINQVMEFSGQEFSYHDDAPDIVAEFSNRINNINVIQKVEFLNRELLF